MQRKGRYTIMKKMKAYEIRQMWLDFWKSKGHDIIESASLIPNNDPTLLWINAGVAPLKKYFDGREVPKNKRMANAQKSIRTNDIENVGKTARHHTFFEMLGNFSIGDYFRDDAIKWAVELLTSDEWFGFDKDKLYITYYPDDVDTFNRWVECGIEKDHLIPVVGNFWEIGEGPCGPDTEIFYDRGIKYDKDNIGPRLIKDDIENDRYIEIWNIVLSQFNSKVGLKRSEYKELPSKNIDTGSGLERLACVMQGVETNYDTDLFMPIINKTEEITGIKYEGQMAFKVIADHVRSTVFALSDGATFSNEGRGYVLRRILRRAVRYGKKLGMNEAFLYRLVRPCVELMEVFYPYLLEKEELVTSQIKKEEEKFLSTLESGEKKLRDFMASAKDKKIDAATAFLLYDTFGFPLELTKEVAEESGYVVDEDGFKAELQKQKERARNARGAMQSMNVQNADMMAFKAESKFLGYNELDVNSTVVGLFSGSSAVKSASGRVIVVLKETPFYAEMGGEIGDKGTIALNGEEFDCIDTIKLPNGQAGMVVEMEEVTISLGDVVKACVDSNLRSRIAANHSATHLMNEALREVGGKHILQQGSYVSDKFLRFDFNNYNMFTSEELLKIEEIVNNKIKKSIEVSTKVLPIEEAKKLGAQAVFGEKYGDMVRVVDMDYSKEFCGGCHVKNTSEIKKFAILSIESKGSGIFRIEAATKDGIKDAIEERLSNTCKDVKALKDRIEEYQKEVVNNGDEVARAEILGYILSGNNIEPKYKDSYKYVLEMKEYAATLKEVAKNVEKRLNTLKKNSEKLDVNSFSNEFINIDGKNVLIKKMENVPIDSLKELADSLVEQKDSSVVLFANVVDSKVIFICKNKISTLSAGSLVKEAALVTLGNGGGRTDFAQAGGKDVTKVDEALEKVINLIKG